jgi:four helix bundle protein
MHQITRGAPYESSVFFAPLPEIDYPDPLMRDPTHPHLSSMKQNRERKSDRSDGSDRSDKSDKILPRHGGYRRLRSFQSAQLAYDLTVRFCELHISKFSRTRDQMVQAARSGVQNIAEGSKASGTSKKTELKLTNVARASLEELLLDYEDFLRQRNLPQWDKDDPRALALRRRLSDPSSLTALLHIGLKSNVWIRLTP